jgi:hypothetical protein
MPPLRRFNAFVTAALIASCVARHARAQVRWDAGAEAGATRRFASHGDTAAPSPGFGPSFGLQGHVALLPMVRVGIYLTGDVSPASPQSPRTFWGGGLHARVSPPLLPGPWRTFLGAGFGYDAGYSAARHVSGGLFEVPIGVGLGRRVADTWLVFVEASAHFGFAFTGDLYSHSVAGGSSAASAYVGQDWFALALSLGLSFER